ncbi:carboxypeptidase-like regulatory domain-containing protein [Maribacter aurantiacus]|uniref:Carboxypeptidase-like regulatory domain-containing protein n=1 Tax=Maribacter aurantiacus TaxID=1882343 RepID=A0A5R8M7X9_9FLAO|nr:carboxypeptidase-like regulatory domain-containing protein [Maribacter aurantiacus]TLF45647.1 carboxypeptidase-like regulatory domain-containing protein [Maribacter aurantiacus]
MHCNRWPILFFLLMASVCWAQEAGFVRGKILDVETKEPIVFATVRILGKAKGIITNMDGSFRLPIEFREAGESIVISSMGFTKKEYALQNLSPKDVNIIYLEPGVLGLSEALVTAKKRRRLSAAQILRRAIKAIPMNYPTREFAAIGYYRDYQLRKNEYVNMNEAFLEVVDEGFGSNDYSNSKIRIYNFQKNQDFKQDFEGEFKYDYKFYKKFIDKAYLYNYGGNEFTILRIHDAIRNFQVNSYDFINVFEKDVIDNHFLNKETDTSMDDEVYYTIGLRQSMLKYLAFGNVYISKRDFSIRKMEYAVYDRFRKLKDGGLNKHGNDHEAIFEVITEYAPKYGKMYPNYISFYNTFEVSNPPEFSVEDVLLNGPKSCFVFKFNDRVEYESALKKQNYDIRLRGERLKIKKVMVFEYEVEVYPDLSSKAFTDLVNEMESKQNKRINFQDIFYAEASNVENLKGSKVNEMTYNTYRQFREFFVQEIRPNGSLLKDTLFMDKHRPIFEDQPTTKPDNFNEYWMNTPLPDIQN